MKFDDYEKTYALIYREFAELVRSLLELTIKKTEGAPRPQSTQVREKDVTSLRRKLEERGLLASERIESEIKDLAGARLIFYTNTDVDRFLRTELIPAIFDVDWEETRVHYPTEENDQQRYQGFHYTVLLSEQRAALPEYEQFKGMRCEIQIQTILNHAWSETQHDMVYHAKCNPGFGGSAIQALDKRFKKIMDDYLRPAGYELQKVQHDYERLMQGKALFDRGALETLESCDNNNERHEVLSTLAGHVIPNYDDIGAVYPEIHRALQIAVQAARNTETEPIETLFGNLPGKTSQDVTLAVVGILDTWRYFDVKANFRLLLDIYKGEQDGRVRKQIVDAIKNLARYHLDIWNRVGPRVQAMLADVIETFSQDDLHLLRPIALSVWRELLKPEMESTSLSADMVTITSCALVVFDGIKAIRNRAIDGLTALFDGSSTEGEKREVVSTLREATRLPGRTNYSNELIQLTLEDTKRITELLTQRAAGQPYELLEHIEQDMLIDYRRARHFADEHDRPRTQEVAKNLMEEIIAFRDLINADLQYIRYKTLVGFESVFPFHWENDTLDYQADTEYRKKQVALYIDEVSDETAEEWYSLIQRCAATQSNDMATFPIFGEFLSQLSKARPNFIVALVQREDADILAFLQIILTGLFESAARDKYTELIENYLGRDACLTEIAHHCRSIRKDASDTVKKVLERAIAVGEEMAVSECLIFAIENHDPQELPLVDAVFLPAIKYLVSKRNAQWIHRAYFLSEVEKFFHELSSDVTDLVLENLLALYRIEYEAEIILTPIAKNQPESIWTFFKTRVELSNKREDLYQAIPYELHSLALPLATSVDLAVTTLREWYKAGDSMFRFTGGILLRAVFPAFTDELAISLHQIIARGSDEDYDFAIHLLENYDGEPPTHEVIKEIIDRLPENDPKLNRLDICLSNIGGVWGEFGMVAAFRTKKDAIALWRSDSRQKVREFAASYVRRMEQQIASEQRSAEIRREMRMRDYEVESE